MGYSSIYLFINSGIVFSGNSSRYFRILCVSFSQAIIDSFLMNVTRSFSCF